MTFSVIWVQAALDQLAREFVPLWGTDQGRAITAAMARIDGLLETNPGDRGESRPGTERVLIEPPLLVRFEIHEEQRVVIVTDARYRRPR